MLFEIRFQFHEFATRLKLSLLRLDTFIWFGIGRRGPAPGSARLSVDVGVAVDVAASVAVAVDVLPCQTDASMQRAASRATLPHLFWGSMQTMRSLSASGYASGSGWEVLMLLQF